MRSHTFLIGGYAGSGKSELSRVLSRLTGAAIIDKDTITSPVVEELLPLLGCPSSDRESQTYLHQVRPYEYEALLSTILENADTGRGVIGTAPFIREFQDSTWINRLSTRLGDAENELILVWVQCDSSTMLERIKQRSAARDAAKLTNWNEYLADIDLSYRPVSDHFIVENSVSSATLQIQASRILTTLQNRPQPATPPITPQR